MLTCDITMSCPQLTNFFMIEGIYIYIYVFHLIIIMKSENSMVPIKHQAINWIVTIGITLLDLIELMDDGQPLSVREGPVYKTQTDISLTWLCQRDKSHLQSRGRCYQVTTRWHFESNLQASNILACICTIFRHDYIIKWKHFLLYWPFVRGFHRSPVKSPHKDQWRKALMFLWSAPE